MKEEIKVFFDSIELAQKLENNRVLLFSSFSTKKGVDDYHVSLFNLMTSVNVKVTKKSILLNIEFSTIRMRDEYFYESMKPLFNEHNYRTRILKKSRKMQIREFHKIFRNSKDFTDFFTKHVVDYFL